MVVLYSSILQLREYYGTFLSQRDDDNAIPKGMYIFVWHSPPGKIIIVNDKVNAYSLEFDQQKEYTIFYLLQ